MADQVRELFWQKYLQDPFRVRGLHRHNGYWQATSFMPGAESVAMLRDGTQPLTMQSLGGGLFYASVENDQSYRLRVRWPNGIVEEFEDPYTFPPVLGEMDLHLFAEGSHWHLGEKFGAMPMVHQGVPGVSFAVWAPNARRVSVVGDFNGWDGHRYPMRLRHEAGVWEIFVPTLSPGALYKYEIEDAQGSVSLRADPVARATEHPPGTASVVAPPPRFNWSDQDWRASRGLRQISASPISIYEVHAASWMRPPAAPTGILDWDGLADRLIPYVRKLGFTHIELMPIMEHPFSGSWGYQPLSQFAPSARFGSASDFANFVDRCHRDGVGVILDWVPAHFPNDAHGLARFDGTALYEHEDPREGFHPDWNTCVYNLGRREVQGWLIASALWWLEQFHVDGLRVDAVASMLYRDYSRPAGQWIPNRFGGRENLEAIEFLKRLNELVSTRVPGAITIAEESTAWPGVTAPVNAGGLGFSFKWNMGWMHDSLRYLGLDPIYRRWHHQDWTFGLLYAFSERFVLPLSHDEVVHGKGSLYGRIPGNHWQKLATLRAYFAFLWTHPGKKLLFMGGELAQPQEWNHDGSLAWDLLDDPGHAGISRLIEDLNKLYRERPALYESDDRPEEFRWLVSDDCENSVFAYSRGRGLMAAINMTPVPRHGYRMGLPDDGHWREILNTDSSVYGGSNVGNCGEVRMENTPSHGWPHSAVFVLPPLGALILVRDP